MKDKMKALFKKLLIIIPVTLVLIMVLGFLFNTLTLNLVSAIMTGNYSLLWEPKLFFTLESFLYGALVLTVCVILYLIFAIESSAKKTRRVMSRQKDAVEGGLENSRFMNDKERDANFPQTSFARLNTVKKDGIPVGAVYDKKKGLTVNIASPMHALVIGATGSGKTTGFVNPMIQVLAASAAGSSMICTDPKGELFQLHSKKLQERGYRVMVLDLRDPYSSFRWNPLEEIYDNYQRYVEIGKGIFRRTDSVSESGLALHDPIEGYGDTWYEYRDTAYADGEKLAVTLKTERQKIYDEVYEDLNDLISVICPIESADDPVWEKGARSIIMAVILAMLEDSENPELGMTKEKFNFYNVNKAIGNSDNNFAELRDYFAGRSPLSKAVNLSRQVLSAAENTLASYMSIAFDKLSVFNDEGICSLTSATDIDPGMFADGPTALFLKIPDEKDTRHALAAVFILCIYKALIKKASAREDLSLPRNVYFILDEFGNMPKIEKFDKMITVGRSRKLWFTMIVQSYAQLNNVYGDTVADILKSNCGFKMFIGSNDIDTCKEFSELCGNMTISTTSVSSSSGSREGELSYSSQLQTRPLIYPSDLQKLNNRVNTGNAIIVTFGNYPLKTKFTPSYLCPLYEFGQMDLSEVRANTFFGDEIYYDLGARNRALLHD